MPGGIWQALSVLPIWFSVSAGYPFSGSHVTPILSAWSGWSLRLPRSAESRRYQRLLPVPANVFPFICHRGALPGHDCGLADSRYTPTLINTEAGRS